jgi:hypothetical protein
VIGRRRRQSSAQRLSATSSQSWAQAARSERLIWCWGSCFVGECDCSVPAVCFICIMCPPAATCRLCVPYHNSQPCQPQFHMNGGSLYEVVYAFASTQLSQDVCIASRSSLWCCCC